MKKASTTSGLKEFLHTIPLFAGLPDDDIHTFMKFSHVHDYKKGDYLYRQGDEAGQLIVVRDGWIRLYRSNPDGEEGSTQLYTRGDVLGERAIPASASDSSIKHFFSAQAIGTSCVINIPASIIKERATQNPLIMGRLMKGLMEKMGRLHVENEHMALMSSSQRVACLLLRLSARMAGKGGTFTFPYDKSLAATQLGMKRETFSRALASLKEAGVTVNGSEITIDNFVRLSQYCCTRCSLNTECPGARCMMPVQEKKIEASN